MPKRSTFQSLTQTATLTTFRNLRRGFLGMNQDLDKTHKNIRKAKWTKTLFSGTIQTVSIQIIKMISIKNKAK